MPDTANSSITSSRQITQRSIFIVAGSSLAGAIAFLLAFFWLPARVVYQVEETYTFQLPAGTSSQVVLGVLLPSDSPTQQVEKIEIGWAGEQEIVSNGTLQVVKLSSDLAGGETQARLRYRVTLRQGPARWQGEVEAQWTLPEAEIEADAPQILALAQSAPGIDRQAVYQQYQLAAAALQFPSGTRPGNNVSALAALTSGIGGCNEFANLMVSINRAAGVPSRTVSGLAFTPGLPLLKQRRTWNHPAGAHAWVEFYTSQGWEMAGPSWASRMPNWLYFGRNDGNHLVYAEQNAEKRAYQALQTWAESQGNLVGAMSAPLKFAAAVEADGAYLTPQTQVQIMWDGRWFNSLMVVIGLALVNRWLINRRFTDRKPKFSHPNQSPSQEENS